MTALDNTRVHILSAIAGGETPESLSLKSNIPIALIDQVIKHDVYDVNRKSRSNQNGDQKEV